MLLPDSSTTSASCRLHQLLGADASSASGVTTVNPLTETSGHRHSAAAAGGCCDACTCCRGVGTVRSDTALQHQCDGPILGLALAQSCSDACPGLLVCAVHNLWNTQRSSRTQKAGVPLSATTGRRPMRHQPAVQVTKEKMSQHCQATETATDIVSACVSGNTACCLHSPRAALGAPRQTAPWWDTQSWCRWHP